MAANENKQESLDKIEQLKTQEQELLFDKLGVEEKVFKISGEVDNVTDIMYGACSSLAFSDLPNIVDQIVSIMEKEGRIPTNDELSGMYYNDDWDWAYFRYYPIDQNQLAVTYNTCSNANRVSMVLGLEDGKVMCEAMHHQDWSPSFKSTQAASYEKYGIKQEAVTPHRELAKKLENVELLLTRAEDIIGHEITGDDIASTLPDHEVHFGETLIPLTDGSEVPTVNSLYISKSNDRTLKILENHPEIAEDIKSMAENKLEELKNITYPKVYDYNEEIRTSDYLNISKEETVKAIAQVIDECDRIIRETPDREVRAQKMLEKALDSIEEAENELEPLAQQVNKLLDPKRALKLAEMYDIPTNVVNGVLGDEECCKAIRTLGDAMERIPVFADKVMSDARTFEDMRCLIRLVNDDKIKDTLNYLWHDKCDVLRNAIDDTFNMVCFYHADVINLPQWLHEHPEVQVDYDALKGSPEERKSEIVKLLCEHSPAIDDWALDPEFDYNKPENDHPVPNDAMDRYITTLNNLDKSTWDNLAEEITNNRAVIEQMISASDEKLAEGPGSFVERLNNAKNNNAVVKDSENKEINPAMLNKEQEVGD